MLRFLLYLILLTAGKLTHADAEMLRLATGELPPYATQGRTDQGVALAIVRAAFAKQGIAVQYTFLPWKRAQEEARIGKWDGTAYWGKTAERERDFLLSDNVLTERWVWLYRADMAFNWSHTEDLTPYQIAAIQHYTYTPEFHQMARDGKLQVDWSNDDQALLRKLIAGRADLVPLERNVACYLLDKYFKPQQAAKIRVHPKLMSRHFTSHLMLSRSLPQSSARMQAFNQGLAKLRKSGEYTQMLQSLPCAAGLADTEASE